MRPPTEPPPPPIQFSYEDVRKKLGKRETDSGGGLSGTNDRTEEAWFREPDELSDLCLKWLNRIAANNVPPALVTLLNAGRGLVLPKDDDGGLRPIVVGSATLRFLGSMALSKETAQTHNFS